ncbi:MAG: hypothetical protein JXR48_17940 [Candidatus Delongbacteria bacterium]|nr:hypothetical protein [Candidatus Delongbacteria bacterium]MBN2836841.1 hypothetical protein [Candidatus Delongbacteria bacterium]
MSLFSGNYPYSVDANGRINFKKFLKRMDSEGRESSNYHLLKQKFVKDENEFTFFYLFSEESWEKFYVEKNLGSLDVAKRTAFLKNLCGEATKDSADRVAFPKSFLEFIKADKDLILQGDGDKIQVWSKEMFDKCYGNTDNNGLEDDSDLWNIG